MSKVVRRGQVSRGPAISCGICFFSLRSGQCCFSGRAEFGAQRNSLPFSVPHPHPTATEETLKRSFPMEDEESGMALNFQSTRGQKRNSSELPVQDTLVKQPRRHQITARIGCVVMFLLIGALIAHRIWAFQMRQPMNAAVKANVSQEPTTNGTENKSDAKNFVSHLGQFLCQPLYTGLAENTTCKLCPENWVLYENKCYWISKEKGSWKKGKEDCRARSSQLLVMQKQNDMAFIQYINEEMQLLWIGLQVTFPEGKWTWVDGSPLDDKRSQELGPVKTKTCGILNGNEIISEDCSTITTWVCQTEALNISNVKM